MDPNMQRCPQVLPTIAFSLFKETENLYKQNQQFSAENLQALHAVFGNSMVRAAEILENGYFRLYRSKNGLRKLLMVGSRNEQYALFADINFCRCQAFKYQVLLAKSVLTCKHVLAAKLAEISGLIKVEVVNDEHFVELLNDQCNET